MTSLIWFFLVLIVVAVTKYLTSMRLRQLRERRENNQQSASELRIVLEQALEKEGLAQTEIETLRIKISAMRNLVFELEKKLQKSTTNS